MPLTTKQTAEQWRVRSRIAFRSARHLFKQEDWYGCANRAYYAAFQAATSLCILHGDSFANGWNNPTHEQLPELITNKGVLTVAARRRIVRLLLSLRTTREDADYRMGLTVNRTSALQSLLNVDDIMELLGIDV